MTMHWRRNNSVADHSPPGRSNSLDLGRGPFLQAAVDSISILFCVLFIVALIGSVPLAVFLMLFAKF